ncbi:molybdopterin-synthase adenylyltransferase MoeB [Thermoflexibacter ruber]|uniref:Molybdopterin-synthase adenylyltransferase n=1 Tax=Thermoflexibacter ruber TaxID=1003 RepID=A0A1I2DK97_9BACT|nr:molybdopterin-synthase adenylyltransferase MoeB [Thermoflexibacter ruber]SFE80984.1 adenylyltransferase and sulfurtransferase [Thermoflexibacter ruber]
MLSIQELRRYHRQIILPKVGVAGQNSLKNARVLVIGAGGLGCPLLEYLTAAGVGRIGIVDSDSVDVTNLQRQVIYRTQDEGKPKAPTSAELLQQRNPHVQFDIFQMQLNSQNALQIIENYDIVADCSDNFPTRYLVNDACILLKKPFVYGAIYQFEGQVSVFNLHDASPTYRCLFPKPPSAEEAPNCATAGVFGLLAGMIGLYQANEVLKIILGVGEVLDGKLLMINMLDATSRTIKIKQRFDKNSITELIDYDVFCNSYSTEVTSSDAIHLSLKSITVQELKEALDRGEDIFLLDVREAHEYEICHLEEAVQIPMSSISEHVDLIPQNKKVVVYCHHGMRSANVIKYLEKKIQHRHLYNLAGGIHQWASEIDLAMPTY